MIDKALVIGCGLTGSVIARELAEKGIQVEVWDRRNHIGGNMYDYVEEHGYLVQKYGPHAFHTKEKALYDYICKYETWVPYQLKCGAKWDGKYTPTPFNYTTIDAFYSKDEAERLKKKFDDIFSSSKDKTITVVEALKHEDEDIRKYAKFLFDNDYSLYTAKQWGVSPDVIDPSVLARVPLRFSYVDGYFDDEYQVMPKHSYSEFFKNVLNHTNIKVELGVDALNRLSIKDDSIAVDGELTSYPVIYTGALDELFNCKYGNLPYRSLEFEWKYSDEESLQNAPIVAYPKAEKYTRITEYKKLPNQVGKGTVYAVEYPVPYKDGEKLEPYYPVQTEASSEKYDKYRATAESVNNLYLAGRLADFKYYNMDQALKNALEIAEDILKKNYTREK